MSSRRVAFPAEFLPGQEALVYSAGSAFRPDVKGPGYWVFAPARLAGGSIVIVNRGFVPLERKDPATARARRCRTAASISSASCAGRRRAARSRPPTIVKDNVWYLRDLEAMAAAKHWTERGAVLRRAGIPGAARRLAQAGQAGRQPARQPPAICHHLVRRSRWRWPASICVWLVRRLRRIRPETGVSCERPLAAASVAFGRLPRSGTDKYSNRNALRLDAGRGPGARFRRGHAGRAGPRRRALCAGVLAGARRRETIAGFAGQPYAEVAVEVIRPFVGDSLAEADLARMAHEAYGSFPPSGGGAARPARHQPVRARAVPRADARLQGPRHAAAGAADGPCAARSAASAPPSSSRPPATPAARRSRPSAAAARSTSWCCSRTAAFPRCSAA